MKGIVSIEVRNNRLVYQLEIRRNITIIKGDSATGKTTLIEYLRLYQNLGINSGIQVKCDRQIYVMDNTTWKIMVGSVHESVLFADEDAAFINTKEFAEAVKNSDNYYVLVTRERLANLPYSVTEIYGLRESSKYVNLKQRYNEMYRIYGAHQFPVLVKKQDVVISEDSGSGYDLWNVLCGKLEIPVKSANGNSNIYSLAVQLSGQKILIIADGAAFGAEMNRLEYFLHNQELVLYLPESFEWILLESGLVDGKRVRDILDHPEDYIESSEYISWEPYFTDLLKKETAGTFKQYDKERLNVFYLEEKSLKQIKNVMQGIDWEL